VYNFTLDLDPPKYITFSAGRRTEEVVLPPAEARKLLVGLNGHLKNAVRPLYKYGNITAERFAMEKERFRVHYDNRDEMVHIRMYGQDRLIFGAVELFVYFMMKLQQACDAADLAIKDKLLLVSSDGVVMKSIDLKGGDTTVVRPD
jgi:hypothetical protein